MDDGYDQAYEDRLFETIDWPSDGLPPVRDRPLHRRPRLARRRVGEQLHVRPAAAARAGRRLRRELLDGRRRLREPRALRAARVVARRHGRARSSARARSTRCTAAPPPTSPTRPSAGPGSSATASTTPTCAAGRSRARASRSTTSAGIPNAAARRSKPRRMSTEAFAERAAAGIHDGRPESPDAGARRARVGVHRSGLAQPAVDAHDLARPARSRSAPTDLLAYQEMIVARPARLGHRDRDRRRRPRAVPRVDLRAGRPRPGALDRRRRRSDDLPQHPRLRYQRGVAHDAGDGRRGARRSSATGARPRRPRLLRGPVARRSREFEAYAPLVPVGSYVVVDGHDRERAPGVAGVRARSGRGGEADPRRATASSSPTRDMEKYSLTFNPGGFLRRVR